MLRTREFKRGEFFETRRGACRLGPDLAGELAKHAPTFREAVAPHGEWLARTLLKDPNHPTPLTRTREVEGRRRAVEGVA